MNKSFLSDNVSIRYQQWDVRTVWSHRCYSKYTPNWLLLQNLLQFIYFFKYFLLKSKHRPTRNNCALVAGYISTGREMLFDLQLTWTLDLSDIDTKVSFIDSNITQSIFVRSESMEASPMGNTVTGSTMLRHWMCGMNHNTNDHNQSNFQRHRLVCIGFWGIDEANDDTNSYMYIEKLKSNRGKYEIFIVSYLQKGHICFHSI